MHTDTASQLIVLSDLENDFVNPHDAAHNINGLVVRSMDDRTFLRDAHHPHVHASASS